MADQTTVSVLLRLRDEMSRGLDRAEGRMRGFSNKIRQHHKAIGLAAAASGAIITGVAVKAVRSSMDQQIGIKQLDNALRNAGTSYEANKVQIEKLMEAQQRKTNFGDDAALQKLITISGDYDRSLAALTVTEDMAAAMKMDLGAASILMGKVLAGETSSLSRYGITLEKGATQTEVMTVLTEKFAGAAAAAVDPMIQLKNRIGDLFEAIGDSLVPKTEDFLASAERVVARIITWTEKNPELTATIVNLTVGLGLLLVALGAVAIAGAGLAVIFSPITLIVIAIAAAVTGVVLAFRNWDAIVADFKMQWIALLLPLAKVHLAIKKLMLSFAEWRGASDEQIKRHKALVEAGENEIRHMKARMETHKETIRARREANGEMMSSIEELGAVFKTGTKDTVKGYEEQSEAAVKSTETQITEQDKLTDAVIFAQQIRGWNQKAEAATALEVYKKQKEIHDKIAEDERRRTQILITAAENLNTILMYTLVPMEGITETVEALPSGLEEMTEVFTEEDKIAEDERRRTQILITEAEKRSQALMKEEERLDAQLARQMEALDVTLIKWKESGAGIEDVIKSWADQHGKSTEQFHTYLDDLNIDFNDTKTLIEIFTRETGTNFEDWANDFKNSTEKAAGSIDVLNHAMITLRDSSKINFTQAGVEAYKTDPRFMGREGEFTEQIRSRIPQFKDMSQDKLESVEMQLQARLSDQYENLRRFKNPEKHPAEWAFLKNVQTPDIENSIALFDQFMNAKRKGTMDSFANGGISRGGLALVGERGPEVVSLPGGSRVHPSGMGSNTFIFNGAVYGAEDLKRVVVEAVRDHAIAGGFSGVFAGA